MPLKKTGLKNLVKKFSFTGMSKDAGPDKTVEESKPVSITTQIYLSGQQGWRSGESARLPPKCPGLDSRSQRHM